MDEKIRSIRRANGQQAKKRLYEDRQAMLMQLSEAEVRQRLKTLLRNDPVAMKRYHRYIADEGSILRTYDHTFRGFTPRRTFS